MLRCPYCNAVTQSSARFCGTCGRNLPQSAPPPAGRPPSSAPESAHSSAPPRHPPAASGKAPHEVTDARTESLRALRARTAAVRQTLFGYVEPTNPIATFSSTPPPVEPVSPREPRDTEQAERPNGALAPTRQTGPWKSLRTETRESSPYDDDAFEAHGIDAREAGVDDLPIPPPPYGPLPTRPDHRISTAPPNHRMSTAPPDYRMSTAPADYRVSTAPADLGAARTMYDPAAGRYSHVAPAYTNNGTDQTTGGVADGRGLRTSAQDVGYATPPHRTFSANVAWDRTVADVASPTDASANPRLAPTDSQDKAGRRRTWLAVGGALAAILAIVAGWWIRRPRLEAHIRLDDSGHHVVTVECESCLDGSRLTIGNQSGEFRSGLVSVALPEPLPIGNTTLVTTLYRPHAVSGVKTSLAVSIPFRILPDATALGRPVPVLRWSLQAVRGVNLFIDQQPIPLDAQGNGTYELPLSVTPSSSADPPPLQRTIHYAAMRDGRLIDEGNQSMSVKGVGH